MQTIAYKSGFIHINFMNPAHEIIKVQVDKFAYPIQVKSVLAAKRMISAHIKNYGGNK